MVNKCINQLFGLIAVAIFRAKRLTTHDDLTIWVKSVNMKISELRNKQKLKKSESDIHTS